MKKSLITIALLLGLQLSLTASAQDNERITLSVPDFVRPLVEKWAAEYQKTAESTNHNNTPIDFQFISGKSQDSDNTVSFSTDDDAILVARYAVLPVTTKGSEAEQLIGSHALNAKKLKNLFFVNDDFDDERKESKLEHSIHIFSGNSRLSASRLYAAHFSQETANYKGKKISGDDSYLNLAINRDPLGVTVNSLSNIFDLQSRQLRQTLALLPLDIDKQGRQVLSEGRLDDIIRLLESEQYAEIPIGKIGFNYHHANPAVIGFINWVLHNGSQYVHQYGLLALPQKELTAQQHRLEQKDLAQK